MLFYKRAWQLLSYHVLSMYCPVVSASSLMMGELIGLSKITPPLSIEIFLPPFHLPCIIGPHCHNFVRIDWLICVLEKLCSGRFVSRQTCILADLLPGILVSWQIFVLTDFCPGWFVSGTLLLCQAFIMTEACPGILWACTFEFWQICILVYMCLGCICVGHTCLLTGLCSEGLYPGRVVSWYTNVLTD